MPTAVEATLALMMLLQQPGRSPYSTITLAECDESCQREPVCDLEMLSCAPPRWSPKRNAFFRLETREEGVRRYADIATIVSNVAERADNWRGDRRDLRRLLLTVAFHESGFRRDVHEGSTRGDCDYHEVSGGVREPVPGSCRSHCLGQIFVMPNERTARGYLPDDLVGLGHDATRRCVETMADRLGEANRACKVQRGAAGAHPACTMGMYGGVSSYSGDPRITARARTFERLRIENPTLSPDIRALLPGG